MSDEHKPHDDHGHAGHDDHVPVAPAAHGPDSHGHEDHAAHPAADAHGHDDHAHGHDAHDHDDHAAHPVEDHSHGHGEHANADHSHDAHGHEAHGHDDHAHDSHAAPVAAAVAGGATVAAAVGHKPVWSDSGEAPFEDVDTTPVYARGKGGKKKSGGGSSSEGFEFVKTIFFALLIAFVLRVVLFQPFTIPSASMEPNLYEGDYIVVSKWSYGYSKHSIPFSPPIFDGRVMERTPHRGDIVVFKLPRDNKTDYIKRLIGLPGDRIQMINNVLQINGQPVRDVVVSGNDVTNMYGMPIVRMRETLPEGKTITIQDFGPGNDLDDTPVFEVPAGHYFMMGDNRDNSIDSRVEQSQGVGLVPAENLIGKAEIILFSWSPGASLWNPVSWFSKIRPSRFFTVLD
ncbi:MAG: signal peptidase I [Brevundimonas sp.]|nr:MAG: signal peptidase I [Brevundimonas sp.]